ncbi:hypothetical protein CgunFtcFv8_002393 [Champsocephalus gunnari]|uniref:Uncharacterized protein n=1 Tax=Champsocephalus gunnari TaxID=52237 RepID=A0AAN8D8Q1_CHAGU|nr:hypothetical protein CgunFtcFv8_002393 [Champsocephalus gunnari]
MFYFWHEQEAFCFNFLQDTSKVISFHISHAKVMSSASTIGRSPQPGSRYEIGRVTMTTKKDKHGLSPDVASYEVRSLIYHDM